MLKKLQKVAKLQKIQLDNLVDFEKLYKTRICLQRSAPIQPKTSEILPKFCQNLATTLRPHVRGRELEVEGDPLAAGHDLPAPAATVGPVRERAAGGGGPPKKKIEL